ncbi:hypothetical protein DSM3645_14765 [Blastopirellula marina DSM 3645]|uniref:Uncharacterized protein n=1 Tax=Blastopirellula marina DSM 3645 TaxID=314230 RepID=A3ZSF7_9BACT|nr:hypothetical protein DSM3645_14765 [Blastopirellula marina DSM 3645]
MGLRRRIAIRSRNMARTVIRRPRRIYIWVGIIINIRRMLFHTLERPKIPLASRANLPANQTKKLSFSSRAILRLTQAFKSRLPWTRHLLRFA